MNASEKPEFKRLLTNLGSLFQREIDAALLDSYFEALRPLSIGALRRAFAEAEAECQYFPKPVELRGYAQEPERFRPKEIDGEVVYACLKCHDSAVVLTDRYANGRSVGTYAAPCDCRAGDAKRSAWERSDSKGHTFADSAKANTQKLRRMGA